MFHKLIEFTNFNIFIRVGEVKYFFSLLRNNFWVFLSFSEIHVHMFTYISQVYDIIVFYHDQTGHVVVWILAFVLCQQLQQWIAQGCVSWQKFEGSN